MIDIEIFPASYGDCFLVSCGFGEQKTNILIDGGFYSCFKHVEKKLKQLRQENQTLRLIVVTHIDRDHITGIIKLLIKNGKYHNPKLIPIEEIWHNGFKHMNLRELLNSKFEKNENSILNLFGGIPKNETNEFEKVNAEDSLNLCGEIYKNGYSKIWNSSVNGQAISINNFDSKDIGNVKIILLSPTKSDLTNLDTICIEELEEKGGIHFPYKDDDKRLEKIWENIIASKKDVLPSTFKKVSNTTESIEKLKQLKIDEDKSIPNKSSISFIIEFDKKKVLFLGDCTPSNIISKLEKLKNNGYNLFFDTIKISHHGSNKNTNQKLLDLIDSENFIFSTNGMRFNHPDIETLIWIVGRETKTKRNLIFNYETEASRKMRDETMKKYFKNNYEVFEVNPDIILNPQIKEKSYCLTLK